MVKKKKEADEAWMKNKRAEKVKAMKEVPDTWPTKSDLPEMPETFSNVITDILEGEIRRRTGYNPKRKEEYGKSSSRKKGVY